MPRNINARSVVPRHLGAREITMRACLCLLLIGSWAATCIVACSRNDERNGLAIAVEKQLTTTTDGGQIKCFAQCLESDDVSARLGDRCESRGLSFPPPACGF